MHIEFDYLTEFFVNNGFPKSLILSEIRKLLNKLRNCPGEMLTSTEECDYFFVFPFYGSQSEKLESDLRVIVQKYFPKIKVNIVLKSEFKVGSFFNYKDRLSTGMRANLVYQFSCERCSHDYIGSTSRNLYMRVAEHAGVSFRSNIPLNKSPNSSIRDHCNKCKSSIDISKFKILNSPVSKSHLQILESLYIRKLKPRINDDNSAYPLCIVE